MSECEGNWWAFGDYTGDVCPNCSRLRLMSCEDLGGRERIICEKCDWEPATNSYRGLAEGTEAAQVVASDPGRTNET